MRYPFAERFKAPQGEGAYTGTQMAFMRLVGCSVGQKVCTHCDTDFDRVLPELGGGMYTPDEMVEWMGPVQHACITGGEPMDRDLRPLLAVLRGAGKRVSVESSGTVRPAWLGEARHMFWLTVSPKPGWLPEMVAAADELKVILGGLGDGPGWPTVDDAVRWAGETRLVYVQPRNDRMDIRRAALSEALDVVAQHPTLRLSTQLHKFLRTR